MECSMKDTFDLLEKWNYNGFKFNNTVSGFCMALQGAVIG